MGKKLKVAFCASEMVPFVKTGGLADVAGALPLALEDLGVEVKAFLPGYKAIGLKCSKVMIGRSIEVHFIEKDEYFSREGLYGDSKADYPDNLKRFSFFCQQVLKKLKELNFQPDIVHCHDWQTALIPVYLKTIYKNDLFYSGTKTLLTIHNLGYQGLFPRDEFPQTGLTWDLFQIEGLEYYNQVNILKGGLLFSDGLNTVSPTYAEEIQTPESGHGLEGVLQRRSSDLSGILNGIDYQIWDPGHDKNIACSYTVDSFLDKYKNKKDLQVSAGLPPKRQVPLLGLISRLADQKGLDILTKIMDWLFKKDVQFVLLGTGDEKYHRLFEKLAKHRQKKISVNLKFDPVLAHKIYAGADIFLMPSRYEPCGLGQLISLRYGTIPLVRQTGGLKDTVVDYTLDKKAGNGFVFVPYTPEALREAIQRALEVYQQPDAWQNLIRGAMAKDFSWKRSAAEYVRLYRKMY